MVLCVSDDRLRRRCAVEPPRFGNPNLLFVLFASLATLL